MCISKPNPEIYGFLHEGQSKGQLPIELVVLDYQSLKASSGPPDL